MFWQGPHLAKYASKEIYKIRKMVTFLFLPFLWPLWSVFTIQLHVILLRLWISTCQVSLFLYKNVVYEIKSSQLKNYLVLVDMKNTIGYLAKKCKMIIKIMLFVVNNTAVRSLCWGGQKHFSETINLRWLCCYNRW